MGGEQAEKQLKTDKCVTPRDGTVPIPPRRLEYMHTPTPTRLQIGATLGPYKITALLGEGGMGRVFGAVHEKLGRRVALKVLRSDFSHDQSMVRRFFQEARAVNRIAHPGIVEVTDFVEGPSHAYCVMEYLEGHNLARHIRASVRPSIQEIANIGAQVADALVAAHRAGVLHRDLKPENIMVLSGEGAVRVKLLDFGIAKLTLENELQTVNTQAGVVLGTPYYMSPEQTLGQPLSDKTDVYSLGVVLYEALTGSRPFRGSSPQQLAQAHQEQAVPRPLRQGHPLPLPLERHLFQCLHKQAQARPTAAQVRDVLHTLADATTQSTRRLAWGGGLGLLTAAAVSVVLLMQGSSQQDSLRLIESTAHHPSPAKAAPVNALVEVEEAANTQRMVRVILESSPTGAEVYRDGKRVGKTPLTLHLAAQSGASNFEFRKEGYISVREPVSLQTASRTKVVLAPEHVPAKAPPVVENPRDALINPFASIGDAP